MQDSRPSSGFRELPPETRAALLAAIRAQLVPDPRPGMDPWTYARLLAPGIRVALEVATPTGPRLLTDGEVAALRVPSDELFDAGWFASAAEPIEVDREIAPGIRALAGHSRYVAVQAADLRRLLPRLGSAPHGVVFGVPHGGAILTHVVRRDTVLVIEQLAELVERMAAAAGQDVAISGDLYFWDGATIERLALDAEPSARFAGALGAAMA